jgi:hypothetical protein
MAIATAVVAVATAAACSDAPIPSRPGPADQAAVAVAAPTRPAPVPFPPAGLTFLGVQTNLGPYDFAEVDAFTAATHHQPAALQFTQGWAHDRFDAGRLNAIAARGMLPVIAWEPYDYTLGGSAQANQPEYQLAAITAGRYDSYIRTWATGIAALPYPVVIRFAHEMNGNWYPWCESVNGNQPGDYVRAWRHVHDVFAAAGARNVTWMWSPNVTYPGAAPLVALYPGDSYVDWIGLSGYYGTAGMTSYKSFDQIFSATIAQLRTFTAKPVVISETGATNMTGQQARWIAEMFADLAGHPDIVGVIWFEAKREIDWHIANVAASAMAFGTGAADPRYQTPWAPNDIPRTS